MEKATNELDAVIQATEQATETILSAAERINSLVEGLRPHAAVAAGNAALDAISEDVIRIFEACNFQDITGQRITKVVNTMKFVEERVDKMTLILGGADAFAALEPEPESEEKDQDEQLLHGPQLTHEDNSQDDIDKFFN